MIEPSTFSAESKFARFGVFRIMSSDRCHRARMADAWTCEASVEARDDGERGVFLHPAPVNEGSVD